MPATDAPLVCRLSAQVMTSVIISTPVAYTSNGTFLALASTAGVGCPGGQAGDVVGLRLHAGAPPNFTVAWCAASGTRGRTGLVVTSPGGNATAIVWVLGEPARAAGKLTAQPDCLTFGSVQ